MLRASHATGLSPLFLFLAVIVSAGMAGGCSDNSTRPPATETARAGGSPTVPQSETPGTQVPALPPDVGRVVDVLIAGDVGAFNSLLEELPEPCAAHPSGVGSPPPCPTGVPDGGTINTFRYISCERGYPGEQQREVTERILKQKRKLYAVFQPQPGTLFTLIPKGEYSLIFISETPQGEQLGERYEE